MDGYTPHRSLDLATFRDIRREMGRVYRGVRSSKVPAADGTRMIYMLREIARVMELEAQLAQQPSEPTRSLTNMNCEELNMLLAQLEAEGPQSRELMTSTAVDTLAKT